MKRTIDRALTPAIVVVAFAALGVGLSEKQANDASRARQTQIASCDRGNIVRGYLLLRAREFRRTDQEKESRTTRIAPMLFPVLDCTKPTPRRLPAPLSERYLRVLNSGREPVVDGDDITARRWPAAP